MLLSQARARLRIRVKDAEAPYIYSDSVVNTWLNDTIADIAKTKPFLLEQFAYTNESDATNVFHISAMEVPLFMKLKNLYFSDNEKPLVERPYDEIKSVDLTNTNPSKYVLINNESIYLNGYVAEDATLNLFYWRKHKEWVDEPDEGEIDDDLETLTPESILGYGYSDMILHGATVKAGEDINNEFGDSLVAKFAVLFRIKMNEFATDALTQSLLGTQEPRRVLVRGS